MQVKSNCLPPKITVPEQWPLASFCPSLYIEHGILRNGISLWSV